MSQLSVLADRVGFIGAGQMAQALATGWVHAGLLKPEQIVASDPSEKVQQAFLQRVPGARVVNDNQQLLRDCSLVVLAVKPQMTPTVLSALKGEGKTPLLISIVAGYSLTQLNTQLSGRWIRVMPNTPCLVGESASAFAAGGTATEQDRDVVRKLLNSVGLAWELPEKLLDAVTGLSGSGPAYMFLMIEALSDGGVRMGLPREVATALAAQTMLGAAKMLLVSGEHPGTLKDRVASPGGTTIAGLYELEEHGVRGALMAAVAAASERSRELANGK
jgi:pyrroline-5-carboxylate reductase